MTNWRQNRAPYSDTHDMLRSQAERFFATEVAANGARWEAEGKTELDYWKRAAAVGLIAPQVPEEYGGAGLDISYNFVITEEIHYAGAPNTFTTHSDVCVDYLIRFGTEEQKQRWLPGVADGSIVMAIVLTEPGAGSDLRGMRTLAKRDGQHYILNGSKTYISNGQNANLLIVAARTAADSKNISLFFVESNSEGFARGRNLDKIGQHSGDTSELFFSDVRIPAENLLGEEGKAMSYMVQELPKERMSIAVGCQAGTQRVFDEVVKFTKDRTAFGQRVIDFQNTGFCLADMATKLQVGWAHLDWAITRLMAGQLSVTEAAAAKLWHSEMQWEVVDMALQLHGGAGYMNEYPIARLWRDARVHRIYGGTSEIMKEVIRRSIV
ncbi:MAG: acyl-CoA dehydrogenase family protein [Porticoccaceae bacterium]|nr:acyl-CoA dehydrogenase family protein [Porticoccaceae bacterium]